MEEVSRCDVPNATHQWNILQGEMIKKSNYCKNHFSLTEEKQELLENVLDVLKFCSLYKQTAKYHNKIAY